MKIEEQVLSIEQMQHLQELGVDISDASMCWVAGGNTFTDEEEWNLCIPNRYLLPYNIPTYTIGDLIEKLPKTIEIYHLMIDWNLMKIEYTDEFFIETVFKEVFIINDKPLINTLYDCLCWVAGNHKELLNKE